MSKNTLAPNELSRRTVLRRGAVLSSSLGLALVATSGQAVAMKNAELIEAMASEAGVPKDDAKTALDAFIYATTKALMNGDSVSLTGVGSFSISKRSVRTGRNPQTGKEIQIAAKNVVKFKAGAELSKVVN